MDRLSHLKKDFAELAISNGIGLKKGQRLAINCPVECADFARECAAAAYRAGCREVITLWYDDELTKLRFLHAEDDVFDKVNEWDKLERDLLADEGCAWLAIYAEDPESLKDADPDRIKRNRAARGKAFEKFMKKQTRNEFQWCVVSVPTKAWAKAVFPSMSEEDAVTALWEQIFKACRVDGENSKANWEEHSRTLQTRVEKLNSYAFKTLRYSNSLGTDLTIDLPKDHYWAGGSETAADGTLFSANIPTEEVFTLPVRTSANGKVAASKPLCLNGNLIENFYFIVKDGKIVEAHAEKGEEVLRDALRADEGASYFGEVALVPYHSPISQSGVLFLNTLFDENASCHIAFGEAYPCIKGSENMSEEELKSRGVNYSMMHEDFMIGTEDLSIIGVTEDGREIPVFTNGDFSEYFS